MKYAALVILVFSGTLLISQSISEVEINSDGIIFPRLSTIDITALVAVKGQCIYNIDTDQIQCFDGSNWMSSYNLLSDTDGDTKVTTEEFADEDKIRFQTDSREALIIDYNKTFDNLRFNTDSNFGNLFIGSGAGENYDRTQSTVLGQSVYLGSNAGTNSIANSYGNVFLGFNAGFNNDLGSENVFIGNRSGENNLDSRGNTFVGYYSGNDNTIGRQNTFIGSGAGGSNLDGDANVYIGFGSGVNTINDAVANTFLGYIAGGNHISGGSNTFIGFRSGDNNVSGIRNTHIGYSSGRDATGSYNIFLGNDAGRVESLSHRLYIENSDTTQPLIYGQFETNKVGINWDSSVIPPSTLNVNGSIHIEDAINLKPTASIPNSPTIGTMYMDDGTNTGGVPTLRYWNGINWINI